MARTRANFMDHLDPDLPVVEAVRVVLEIRLRAVEDIVETIGSGKSMPAARVHHLRVATRRADAALRVLISRLGVYSARSAMFWIRSALISAVLKLVAEIDRSLRKSSRPLARTTISSTSRLGAGTSVSSASTGNRISRSSEVDSRGSGRPSARRRRSRSSTWS